MQTNTYLGQSLLLSQRNYAYALPRAQEILEMRQKHLPPEDRSIPQSMSDLAYVYDATGRTEDALKLFRESLNLLVKYQGEQSMDVAFAKVRLAETLLKVNRYEEATSLYQQVLKFRQDLLGEMHPDTADTMNTLATVLEKQGLHDQALPLRQQIVEIEKRLPNPKGTTGRYVQSAISSLACTLRALGREEEAEKLDPTSELPRRRRPYQVYLSGSPEINRIKQKQPTARIIANDLKETEVHPETWSLNGLLQYYVQEVFRVREEYGEDHPDTFSLSFELVLQLQDNGFYTMARDLARYLVLRYPVGDSKCPVSPLSVAILHDGFCIDDALESQEKLVSHFRTFYRPCSMHACKAVCKLAKLLQDRSCHNDAIAALEEHLQLCRQAEDPSQPCVAEVYKKLIIAYQDAEQFDKSVPLKEELWEFYKQTHGNDGIKAMSVMCELIDDYRDFGQPERSKQLQKELDAMEPDALFPETPRRYVKVELPSEPAPPISENYAPVLPAVPSKPVPPVFPPKIKTD